MHEIFIDFLQYSVAYNEDACIGSHHTEIRGFGFYTRGYEDAYGVRRFYGNPNSKKALVIMSGKAMHNRRVGLQSDVETINSILALDGKITRIDHCITDYVEDDLITPKDVANYLVEGRVTGTLVKHGGKAISSIDVGQPEKIETCYIGNPKKRGTIGIFRAYDKGVELGLCADIIARLELEERGDNAHNSARRIAQEKSIQSVMKSRIQFKGGRFDRLFDEGAVDLSRGDQVIASDLFLENEKRWTWLFKQVAPALAKAVEFDNDHSLGQDRMWEFLKLSGIVDKSTKNDTN
jgi:hypothetical protein